MYKVCSLCKQKKPLEDFGFKYKKRNIRQYHCLTCSRAEIRRHYYANHDYYLSKARHRNLIKQGELKSCVLNYLKNHPCVDCGEDDPVVLEFDHIRDKYKDIAKLVRNNSLKRLEEEIPKCEVRCANCHRRKTLLAINAKIYKAPS